jgi:hypothetical protein
MRWILTILVCVSGDCHTITQRFPAMTKCVETAFLLTQAIAEAHPETMEAAQKISCEWGDEQ